MIAVMGDKKIVIQTAIRPNTKTQIEALMARRGMTQIEIISRLLNWFAGLDHTMQALILDQVEESDRKAIAEIVLRRISRGGSPTGSDPKEQGTDLAKTALQRGMERGKVPK